MNYLLKQIIARLTFGTVVILYDHDGETTIRIARRYGGKKMLAWRWAFKIGGPSILATDGTIAGGPSYVKRWEGL